MTITVLPKYWINRCAEQKNWQHLASVGFAQSMVELSIQDANGNGLPAGQRGEICVKGRVVMAAYWQDPQATEKAIRNGWLNTGDVGVLDEYGFLTLLDRSKDLVVSGGSNIYPREVEEILLNHEAVAEVSVIGRSDPEWGEVVVAYVVLQDAFKTQVNANTLDLFCLDNIARFKRPKHYCFVEALPKNNYGKVLKTTLREWDLKNHVIKIN
jgi:long-chain acyl-CoA synthetase